MVRALGGGDVMLNAGEGGGARGLRSLQATASAMAGSTSRKRRIIDSGLRAGTFGRTSIAAARQACVKTPRACSRMGPIRPRASRVFKRDARVSVLTVADLLARGQLRSNARSAPAGQQWRIAMTPDHALVRRMAAVDEHALGELYAARPWRAYSSPRACSSPAAAWEAG